MNTPLKVLIVEDSEDDALLVIRQLRNGGYDPEFKIVETAEALHAALEKQTWDIVISDYNLPQFNAPAALNLVIESGLDLPFIIVSGAIGEETAVAAMREGANDYLMKDNLVRISAVVERELREAESRRERCRVEKSLRENEEKYRLLFEQMPQGAFYQRMDGSLIDVNPAALKMFGVTREDFLGRTSETPAWNIIHEDGSPLPGGEHPSMVALRTGKPVSGVVAGVLNERTQERVWLEVNAIPEFQPGDDKPFQVMVTMHDLTDHKQTQMKLKESEAKFRSVTEQSLVGIYLISEGVLKYVNPKFAEIFGYTVDECLDGMHFRQLVHPADLSFVEEQVQKRLSGISNAVQYSFRGLKKNGKIIQTEVFGSLIHHNGKLAASGTILNITERKEMEMSLRTLAESSVGSKSETYQVIVRQLALALGVRYTLLARIESNDPNTAHTLAVWHHDEFSDNFSYTLDGTPCQNVTGQGPCFYPRDIQALFPGDLILANMGAESYWGTPLKDADGNVLGILAILDDRPMEERPVTLSLLKSFAIRAAAEVERERSEKSLRQSEEHHLAIIQTAMDGFWLVDKQARLLEVNKTYCGMSGYSEQELLTMNISDLEAVETAEGTAARIKKIVMQGEDRFETRHRRKDGSIFDVEISVQYRATGGGFLVVFLQDITKRRQAEAALKNSEEQFRTIFNQSFQFSCILDGEGVTLAINDLCHRVCGELAEGVIHRPFWEAGWWRQIPDSVSKTKIAIQKVFKDGSARDDIEFMDKNGNTRHGIRVFSPIKDSQGTIRLISVVGLDITEKEAAEKQSLEKEKALRLSLDAAKAGTWTWDVQTGAVVWDDQMQKIFGFTPGTFDGTFEAWKERVHPDDIEMAEKATLYALEHGERYNFEYRVKGQSGEWNFVNAYATVVKDTSGKPVRMSGFAMDITEHKRAEEVLKESQERFKLAMEFANDGLFDWNLETKNIYYSPGWKKLLGYENHEIKNQLSEWGRFTKPEDFKSAQILMDELLEGKRNRFEKELRMRHKSGHWVDILSRANVVFDENGKAVRIVGTHVDITERKKIEIQLQQAQKMEAIGTLAGGIAHDFNNILFPIVGYAEMIAEDVAPDSANYEYINLILKSAIHAKGLVQQILTFSRQREQELKPMKADIIIRETLKFMRSSLPSTIELYQDVPKDCGLIMADPTEIHQIVMNLCTNAYHAMEDTGGRLTVHLAPIEWTSDKTPDFDMPAGSYLCLKVSDTGHGMEADVLKRIFDPYYTTKKKGKGTGLGLAVVHGIVRGYGGEIVVHSIIEEGSIFQVFFPLIQTDKQEMETETISDPPKGDEKILLVDDEEYILSLERQILVRLGYDVTPYSNSSEALLAFRRDPEAFDLVISDVTMPGISGERLAMEVMKLRPDIPVILCTGYNENITQEKIDSLGIKGFLLKPIPKKTFAEKIRKVLDQ